jgi:hypothetical protein
MLKRAARGLVKRGVPYDSTCAEGSRRLGFCFIERNVYCGHRMLSPALAEGAGFPLSMIVSEPKHERRSEHGKTNVAGGRFLRL